MVLIKGTSARLLMLILWVCTLNACSLLSSQKQSNRSPDSPIIPVKSNTTILPSSQTKQIPATDTTKQQDLQTNDNATNLPSTKKLSPSDVLGSVLDSAKKAISNQQWLRAQHHLENALRIAPKDAQVFLLYAEVYEGLGVPAQEVNMLKRALFLAKPNSEIYLLAKERLARKE